MPFKFIIFYVATGVDSPTNPRFSRLIAVPRENRSASKLLKDLASPTGFEPVFTP
jgi:hypothetical protein